MPLDNPQVACLLAAVQDHIDIDLSEIEVVGGGVKLLPRVKLYTSMVLTFGNNPMCTSPLVNWIPGTHP